jgi:hypothetical protein
MNTKNSNHSFMFSINLKRILHINWWLWACLSIPPILYLLFNRERDKAGDFSSAWNDLVNYVTRSDLHFRYAWGEILVPRILFPLIIGWVTQYFLMLTWNCWKQERKERQNARLPSDDDAET